MIHCILGIAWCLGLGAFAVGGAVLVTAIHARRELLRHHAIEVEARRIARARARRDYILSNR